MWQKSEEHSAKRLENQNSIFVTVMKTGEYAPAHTTNFFFAGHR